MNPNEPASPTYKPVCDAKGEVIAWEPHGGMTKREEFVKAAMQGILASTNNLGIDSDMVAVYSRTYADRVIAALAKDQT